MSEAYKFTTLSEVEMLETPTDTTTLLAVEGDTVKQIPASGFSTGGSSVGGGGFTVMGTLDVSTYAITTDKTHEEIVMAVANGCAPVLILPVGQQAMLLPLIVVDDQGVLHFAMSHPTYQLEVTCTAENVWGIVTGD